MSIIEKTQETHPLTWWVNNRKQTVWIHDYISKNGYKALSMALKNTTESGIIDIVKQSGLKGRGGAGFLTGIKWSLVSDNNKIYPHYLLCNADEMEPGTYKDRLLMEQIPHQLIEGMLIAAFAIKSSCGYIFLRGEYIKAEYILNRAISEAKELGYLGKNILGSNFSFNVFLHTGAGRYICGEETALINSLEGRRANPRFKPPFPASVGLWGKPTCVNNVETLSNIPAIILHGVDWYKSLSKSKDTGTKMMGFSGRVNHPGVWELPFGTSAREILEKYAGGMKNNFSLKAWLPGGAGTDFLTIEHLDVPMDFSNLMSVGSRLGTGLAMAVDHNINMVSLVRNLEEFFARESCGWCTPCRDGLPWIVKILCAIEKGIGKKEDMQHLEELCDHLGPGKTFCAHAPGAVSPLRSAIKYFRSDFENRIK
ncbi:NADH-quinone oxidoreductase subunit F [Buchnera aphidicola (Eriosoma lanigerum)]|uniref:NADH-quinone oxidoreductase subunit NuoF n=1 Tax=Buchnera aphidicola TaxID=9 RepID=UPI003463A299